MQQILYTAMQPELPSKNSAFCQHWQKKKGINIQHTRKNCILYLYYNSLIYLDKDVVLSVESKGSVETASTTPTQLFQEFST